MHIIHDFCYIIKYINQLTTSVYLQSVHYAWGQVLWKAKEEVSSGLRRKDNTLLENKWRASAKSWGTYAPGQKWELKTGWNSQGSMQEERRP